MRNCLDIYLDSGIVFYVSGKSKYVEFISSCAALTTPALQLVVVTIHWQPLQRKKPHSQTNNSASPNHLWNKGGGPESQPWIIFLVSIYRTLSYWSGYSSLVLISYRVTMTSKHQAHVSGYLEIFHTPEEWQALVVPASRCRQPIQYLV